ncbi:ABC transporter ATP-binding protein [Solibaculum mannosilyticum]|uniref:Multidrug ABC transporter ATP-binding protein n=1 Tax=Solibaculum mannosilyticum TaxID=2780922 RepID=A0A7I8D493_9FIRM|nr:ABC transporter ATP-binding protein [Solibaculum mannosilyticum]BCI60319.1 multidrug ABC transporter ATP-binding protein [Solibaculum mannosilyticum]
MIEVLKKIWRFAGEEQKNIRKSIIGGFFYAIFHMFQIAAIYVIVLALVDGSTSTAPAWQALGLLIASILGRAVINRFTQLEQTHAGYFMVANKRIGIGDKLKRIPMGYFNDKSLGELTGITTTVLDEVESTGPMVLVGILGGLINSLVMFLFVLAWDWRIGLLALLGMVLYLLILSAMEKRSARIAPKRQKAEAKLVEAVLEQLQGMSVIKSFNLTGKGDKRVRKAMEDSRDNNLAIEKLFTPYTMAQEIVFHVFSVLILVMAVLFCLNGAMSLANALMAVVVSFLIFSQIQSAGSGVSALRLVGSSIDHANQVDSIQEIDEHGKTVCPAKHDITFEHVDFSYDCRPILKDVSIVIPDKTTTAIVGPSGSGKTTLCSLIARFWDVDRGSVRIGGTDVKDYTLESLMDQVSMVFQKVYLFADTIENNIKFGRPEATHEEVVAAAKQACCDEFIRSLPDGYNTVIGEGGATLSGGEKQRISIARAILKDAPIIIFDEATANVDPENEDKLQRAMEALMQDKTIIMIAHRLKTVQKADQILVLDAGRIVQKGAHQELADQPGLYRDFLTARREAAGWKLG